MSTIPPSSELYILKGCPIDRDYKNTLYFATEQDQNAYFKGLVKTVTSETYQFNNMTYQRVNNDSIRVGIRADKLYDCNYIMFKNTEFGSKWFYAFIDSVDYISNEVSDIYYTIDVMQTWYFDYKLENCLIDREHTETDYMGEHLVPEDIEGGNLVVQNKVERVFSTEIQNPFYFCVLYGINKTLGETFGKGIAIDYTQSIFNEVYFKDFTYLGAGITDSVEKLPIGCKVIFFKYFNNSGYNRDDIANRSNLSRCINQLLRAGCTIINISLVPKEIYEYYYGENREQFSQNITLTKSFKRNVTNPRTYVPKNNKLYTSPFRSIVVTNNDGITKEYEWEMFDSYFDDQNPIAKFNIDSCIIPTVQTFLYPSNYKGISKMYDIGVLINGFQQIGWSEDSFSRWIGNDGNSYSLGVLGDMIGMSNKCPSTYSRETVRKYGAELKTKTRYNKAKEVIGETIEKKRASRDTVSTVASTASGAIPALSALQMALNVVSEIKSKHDAPDTYCNQMAVNTLKTYQNRYGYYIYDMGITDDMAEAIDNFFSMYGYAIRKLKEPNIRKANTILRPHWNYIKTAECIIHPETGKGLNAEDEEIIQSIYNRGITFWMNGNNVGNYSLDNSPLLNVNNHLSSLAFTGLTLSPNFSTEHYNYSITNNTSQTTNTTMSFNTTDTSGRVKVSVFLNGTKVYENPQTHNYDFEFETNSINNVQIKLTGYSNRTPQTLNYNISITSMSENRIGTIGISQTATIVPEFDSDITSYNISNESELFKMTINLLNTSANAGVKIYWIGEEIERTTLQDDGISVTEAEFLQLIVDSYGDINNEISKKRYTFNLRKV